MSDTGRLPFLFEIGTEELPARFLPIERRHVARTLADKLAENALAYSGLHVMATPRRMAVLIDSLQTSQLDREIEVKGPPLSVAYDQDGRPTKAALGFARKNGAEIAACHELADEKGGRFLGVRKLVPGRDAAAVLGEVVPEIVLGIPFPKVMRWGNADLEYARPIQWLVALLGDAIVPLSLAGLSAGRTSRGHRTLADNREVEIATPEAYLARMSESGVVVDERRRREMILAGGTRALEGSGGRPIEDEELLQEVVDLCEYPTPFVGRYAEEFFALPAEVIVTALKSHQRYFAVRRAQDDGLLPLFLAVRDGDDAALDNVVRGNQRVLVARLSDALFYWDCDRKLTPDRHVERLADVTWLEGFGSLRDKTDRVCGLVGTLWGTGLGDGGPVPEALARAAAICKFDLVTEMIRDGKEFTKLEGTIGARYAAAAGESEVVCGILEQYHRPRDASDAVPDDRLGATLSIADRLDTIAGCWLAGFVPTGAKDPYALRRHTLAIQRTLIQRGLRLDLGRALEAALDGFAQPSGGRDLAGAAAALSVFASTRLERLLTDLDLTPEAVRAILPPHGADPTDAVAWARALDSFREQPDFQMLATGFKRCRNILEGGLLAADAATGCVARWLAGGRSPAGRDFSDLPESAEQRLRDRVVAVVPELLACRATGDYAAIFRSLSALGPDIGRFFDLVRVNVEDPELRMLRHDFLREIYGLFAQYADFDAVAPLEAGS
ncbi:glycine--tRNA ligase subunit beta [bacterium]|nr:glycine--tRNA ligase subunit beta [bacterium]